VGIVLTWGAMLASILLSIVHVGPYLVVLVCIPLFIGYLFRICLIFLVLYFYFRSRFSLFLSE